MRLADASPLKDGTPPGFYPDPLGGAKLRKWDGSQWTDRVRKIQITDCKPASAYTHYRLAVPRPFPFADPYRVVDDDGRESFEIPGGHWYFRQLRLSDAQGAEVARLRHRGRWWTAWWGDERGYDLVRGGRIVARLNSEVLLPVTGASRSKTFILPLRRGEQTFIHEWRIVASLIPRRRRLRPTTEYDLDIAQGVDPIPIFAGCVAFNQSVRGAGLGGFIDGVLGG
jgi:hypothetical protein